MATKIDKGEITEVQPEWALKADGDPSRGVMVALYPDRTVAEALALPNGLAVEDLHVTLAYLGKTFEIPNRILDALPHIVGEWARWEMEPEEGEISGVGRFTAVEPHAFYASVDVRGLHWIRDSVVQELQRARVPVVEDHGFTPHITLAYLDPEDTDPIEVITAHRLRFRAVTLAIGEERHTFELQAREDLVGLSRGAELTGPIVRKDASRQIAYAAVLVPGEPDFDGDELTEKKIEEVAHKWMAAYRNIDLQHSLNNIDAVPVESYLSPADQEVRIGSKTVVLPKGTWILASKHHDPKVWRDIERGRLTGYSVMGVMHKALKAATKSDGSLEMGDLTMKRTTLADLGEDWIAPFVSVVNEPAVPKAKWFALKAAPEPQKGWFRRLLGGAPTARKEEEDMDREEVQEIVRETVPEALKTALEDEDTRAPIVDAVKSAVDEATKPLSERVEAVEKAAEEPEGPEGTKPATKGDDPEGATKAEPGEGETEVAEDVEALKSEVEELNSFKEEVLKRLDAGGSRVAKGQDNEDEEETVERDLGDRDAFGRARKGRKGGQ